MEMTSQRMILGNESTRRHASATGAHRTQPGVGASASGKPSIPSYDSLMDIELTQSMEERYGIREEGLF